MTDERCPHCGGPVKWFRLDVGGETVRARYDCVLAGRCPGLLAKLDQGLPLTEPCPNCGGTAVRQMIEVPELHQPKPWPRVPGELVCMTCSNVESEWINELSHAKASWWDRVKDRVSGLING